MGLDQYAGFRCIYDSEVLHEIFYWRKHARLQVFFAKEFIKHKQLQKVKKEVKEVKKKFVVGWDVKSYRLPRALEVGDLYHLGFNTGEGGVKITHDVVNRLDKERRADYPNCVAQDGFYWGQNWQEDSIRQYKKQDEEFVEWCKEQLKEGQDIVYDCSW